MTISEPHRGVWGTETVLQDQPANGVGQVGPAFYGWLDGVSVVLGFGEDEAQVEHRDTTAGGLQKDGFIEEGQASLRRSLEHRVIKGRIVNGVGRRGKPKR